MDSFLVTKIVQNYSVSVFKGCRLMMLHKCFSRLHAQTAILSCDKYRTTNHKIQHQVCTHSCNDTLVTHFLKLIRIQRDHRVIRWLGRLGRCVGTNDRATVCSGCCGSVLGFFV